MSLSYTQSELTLILNCTTTGLPPTTVTWSKDGVEMSSGDNYVFSQRVIDVNNTMYESIVIIDGESVYDIQGLYQCFVQCYDDIGKLVKNATDSVSVTGEFSCIIVCKLSLCIQILFILFQPQQVVLRLVYQVQQTVFQQNPYNYKQQLISFCLIIINRNIYCIDTTGSQ